MIFRKQAFLNVRVFAAAKAVRGSFFAFLPIFGLLFFFALTEPVSRDSTLARHLAQAVWLNATTPSHAALCDSPGKSVQRFRGVSALASSTSNAPRQLAVASPAISSREAGQVFTKTSHARLSVGQQAEYWTSNGQHLTLKIIAQDPITDEAMPDNRKILSIAPASSSKVVMFVLGQWRYSVEIIGSEHKTRSVVQESL